LDEHSRFLEYLITLHIVCVRSRPLLADAVTLKGLIFNADCMRSVFTCYAICQSLSHNTVYSRSSLCSFHSCLHCFTPKKDFMQGKHLSGNVKSFDSCQGNVRDVTKSWGKDLVREKRPITVCS